MPKCNHCQYLIREGYEYPEYYCKIFGDDIPKKYQTKNDDGCKCTQKFLKKKSDEADLAEQAYWESYASDVDKWYGAREDTLYLVEVIKEEMPIVDKEYLKEYCEKASDKVVELKVTNEQKYAVIHLLIGRILEAYSKRETYYYQPMRWNKDQLDWYKLLDLKVGDE